MNNSRQLACNGGDPRFKMPFVLKHKWGESVKQLLDQVVEDGRVAHFYGGPLGRRFEQEFSTKQGAPHGVAMNSGTSALHICYRLCGVGPGDEVIVPAHAYVSALTAVLMLDAIPVLCDIDPVTYGLDPDALDDCLSSRTKAVTAVHLYGRPCDVDNIAKKASRFNATVIEDCGQGHGAELNGRPVGSLTGMSAWSFFEIKHVCTGEGGMSMFEDEEMAKQARSLVYKGKGLGWWDYFEMGYSYMFTEPQAAFGLASLEKYEEQVRIRRKVEDIYSDVLADAPGIEVLITPPGFVSGAFKTPFRVSQSNRHQVEAFLQACSAENIPMQKGYPALHNIEWIRNQSHRAWSHEMNRDIQVDYSSDKLPVASDLCGRTLSLGTGPGITEEDALEIALTVRDVAFHVLAVQ